MGKRTLVTHALHIYGKTSGGGVAYLWEKTLLKGRQQKKKKGKGGIFPQWGAPPPPAPPPCLGMTHFFFEKN